MNTEQLLESIDSFQCPLIKQLAIRNAEPDLISRAEAATLLGVSLRTVDRLVKSGELKPLRVGKKTIRFMLTDLYKAFKIENKVNKNEED